MSSIKAARTAYSKHLHELQLGTNILKDVIMKQPSVKGREEALDIMGSVDVGVTGREKDLENSLNAGVRIQTPAGKVPDWRRRVSNYKSDQLKLDSNRIDAKNKGMSLERQAEIYGQSLAAAEQRSELTMVTEFLTGSYSQQGTKDNTEVSSNVKVALPAGRFGLPRYNATSKEAPLKVVDFIRIDAMFNNLIKQSSDGKGRMMNSLTDIKKCAIFSTSGLAAFQEENEDKLANRDFFGKSVLIDGYGTYKQLQGFVFIEIPDEYFKLFTSPSDATHAVSVPSTTDAFVPFTTNVKGTGNNQAGKSGLISNAQADAHRCILFYPGAFHLSRPEQLNTPLVTYREQSHSLEWSLYKQWALEGTRFFDLAFEVIFTGPGQKIGVNS